MAEQHTEAEDDYEVAERKVQELEQEMMTSVGLDVVRARNSIDNSLRIFLGNNFELQTKLTVPDPDRWLPFMDLPLEEHANYIDELDRLLHNYLASAYSLSSCMRQIMLRYWKGKPEEQECLVRTPFLQSGLPAFMFGLRNAAQHERIPMMSSVVKASRDQDSGRLLAKPYFFLVVKDLQGLDWSRSTAGLEYLNSLTDSPRLDGLVAEFTSKLVRFESWFSDAFERFHREAVSEFDQLILKRNEVGKPIFDARAEIRRRNQSR